MRTPIDKRASLGKNIVLNLESEGGTHSHAADRNLKTTGNDGAHAHLFLLPDGSLIESSVDGAHIHSLHHEATGEVDGGEHTHLVTLPDGTQLVTESDNSYHWHQLQVETTAHDGAHAHLLDMPGQGSIRSLTSGEFWELAHGAEEVAADTRPVYISRRVTESRVSTELAIAGDKIIEIDTAKQGGADPSGRDLLCTYSIDGDRFAKSLCAPSKADFRFPDDEVKGVVVPVDKGVVELGLRSSDFFEYFISKSQRTNGVLLVVKGEDGGWSGWLNTAVLLPTVVSVTAVRKGWMPAPGKSGMPSSLEAVVPPDLRFWEVEKAEDARAVRDALVESRFLTEENISLVDGRLHRVVHKMFLYEPPVQKAAAATRTFAKRSLLDTLAPVLGARPVATALLPADDVPGWGEFVRDAALVAVEKKAVVHICQPISGAADTAVVAQEVAKLSQDFVLALVDSPENRAQLDKLGAPFKLRYGDQRWVYATSFPVAKRADVDWLDMRPQNPGLPERVVKTIMPDGDVEERFVLGIVLEPETVDAQDDIYSEAEIRSAAHKFMENFQNMGLMHQTLVNNGVRILESFITPVDMTIGEESVKKGTWMLAVRVIDDALWLAVKNGELTGFSIGGSAIRVPD